jgi:hypothetical protein
MHRRKKSLVVEAKSLFGGGEPELFGGNSR